MARHAIILLLTSIITTAAHSALYDAVALRNALEHNRELWTSFSGGAAEYDMEFQRLCYCPTEYIGPFLMHVRLGEVVSATYSADAGTNDPMGEENMIMGEDVGPKEVSSEMLKGLLTVEKLFDEVEKGLDRGYYDIKVTYDETAGFPTSVYVDTDSMLADDETTYTIKNVVIQPPRDL